MSSPDLDDKNINENKENLKESFLSVRGKSSFHGSIKDG